jgi:uncharacterized protein YjiS (DUF1127 family)
MSTTTATLGHVAATATTAAPRKSFYERLIEARMRQAQARVRSIFARMSDAQLADIGFNADQIRAVRVKGTVPTGYWS